MGSSNIHQRTLVRACLVAGDETALARELGVPVGRLAGWLLGESPVPPEAFLRAVDVVLGGTRRRAGAKRSRGTALKQVGERGLAMALLENQSRILERMSRGAPLLGVLYSLVLAVEELSGGMLGSVLFLADDGTMRHGAAPNLPPAYVKAIDGLKIGPAVGSCGTAMYVGKPVIVADIATDPLWHGYRKLALEHGLRACWSAPILSPRGEVLGAFALYYRQARQPNERERQLVQVAAEFAAIAIGHGLREARRPPALPGRAKLSARELQIMRLIAQGEPVKRIATGLRVTISTVYTHRARIFQKLGINSNVRLARYAVTQRLVR